MAPVNAARAVQQNRPRPTAAKNIIVPAIPLTYVQKRQKQSAAHTKAKIEQPVASNPPVVEFLPPSTSPILEPAAAANSTSENGSPSPLQASTTSPASEADYLNESHHTESTEEEVAEPAIAAIAEQEVSVVEESSAEEPQQTPRSAPSEAQSSASRTTYQMPPPFVPSSQSQQPNMSAADPGSMPPPPNFHHGQHPMHHAHPSAGSLRFGGYPESNNSSPAPPPSAGNLPPYPYPQSSHVPQRHGQQPPTNGGHPNGFSPMGPPPPPGYYARPDGMMNHGPNESFMRRQMPGFGPEGGHMPPPGFEHQRYNSFDPSTPHSFHGSQSSAQNDQENGPAFYSQYPTAVISNGSNGHIDEVRLYQQPRPKPRTNSHAVDPSQNGFPHPTGQPPALIDNLDGLVGYLQGQFGDAQFADLTLELRYSDDRAAPVRIPGHNLMFARSPALHALMKAQNTNNDGVAMKTLLIETDDRYLRSDAFWMAMQRLYGGALLDIGAVASVNMLPNAQMSSSTSGIPSDRFELALGYAAAGKLLVMPPVMQRGVEIASHTINMSTLEKALEFALDGGLDYSWTREAPPDGARCPSTYGPLVNLLLTRCMQWIIAGITPGFELDASVGDFVHVRRLPEVPVDRPTTAPNPRLSQIKFGDHPTEESAIVQPSSANSDLLTLSKALINMPFHLLKHVLEAPQLGNAQGWATTALKQNVMYAVVEEREKRRLKVLRNPHVLTEERKTKRKAWEAVGWQESVEAHGTIEPTPILTRTWVDYVLPASPH